MIAFIISDDNASYICTGYGCQIQSKHLVQMNYSNTTRVYNINMSLVLKRVD